MLLVSDIINPRVPSFSSVLRNAFLKVFAKEGLVTSTYKSINTDTISWWKLLCPPFALFKSLEFALTLLTDVVDRLCLVGHEHNTALDPIRMIIRGAFYCALRFPLVLVRCVTSPIAQFKIIKNAIQYFNKQKNEAGKWLIIGMALLAVVAMMVVMLTSGLALLGVIPALGALSALALSINASLIGLGLGTILSGVIAFAATSVITALIASACFSWATQETLEGVNVNYCNEDFCFESDAVDIHNHWLPELTHAKGYADDSLVNWCWFPAAATAEPQQPENADGLDSFKRDILGWHHQRADDVQDTEEQSLIAFK